jgi:hypothetical protein
MHYYFSIDETGDFNILSPNSNSFVCGVLTKKTKDDLNKLYKKAFGQKKLKEIHFSGMNDYEKNVCKECFPNTAEQIFISCGKPDFSSNQQHWWYAALQAVIFGLFENRKFNNEDIIDIYFDGRKIDVLGLAKADNNLWEAYHKAICDEFKKVLTKYEKSGVHINIECLNDKESIFVNLADIICGLVRTGILEAVECDCNKNYSVIDLKNPFLAFQRILQEIVLFDKFGNVKLLDGIFKALRNCKLDYTNLWIEIVKFLKINFETRGINSKIMKQLNELKGVFYVEYENHAKKTLPKNLQLNILISMLLFDTHNGATKTKIQLQDFHSLLNMTDKGEHCRITDNWENYVRLNILLAQIDFNGYNFCKVIEYLNKLWIIQDKIQNLSFPFKIEKDDTTAEITGTIGQAYSFDGNLKEAKEYYEIAEMHINESYFKTASYQFCIYLREQNIEKCYEYFEKQIGKKPADFCKEISEETDSWFLLSYVRLKGLEIHKNGKSNFPRFEYKLKGPSYPSTLILKWLAFENEKAVENLQQAACCLLKESGFTTRTLALPVIQMLYIFDSKNELCRNYGQSLESLKNECENFKKYVNEKSPNLNNLETRLNLWERAMLLPSYYA